MTLTWILVEALRPVAAVVAVVVVVVIQDAMSPLLKGAGGIALTA